jgi:hypothetical protein
MLDANQTSKLFFSRGGIKTHTMEWLRLQTGMDDPFISMFGHRSPTTTILKVSDIDYVLKFIPKVLLHGL